MNLNKLSDKDKLDLCRKYYLGIKFNLNKIATNIFF